MEYLIPVVIIVAIIIGVLLAMRLTNRKRRDADGFPTDPQNVGDRDVDNKTISKISGMEGGAELAREAASKLNPVQHKAIYTLIAQGHQVAAVKEYRKITGSKLMVAYAAIGALEAFPQQPSQSIADYRHQIQGPDTGEGNLAVNPAANSTGNANTNYRYRAIVSKGDEVREISSTRLNDEVFGRVRQLALAKDFDGAADILCQYADVTFTDAREFVTFITN